MKKFENERLHKVILETPIFKYPTPIVYANPIAMDKNTCVFIFVGGLHATNSFNVYMNNFAFDKNYFVTFDKLAHGENKNKPSQYIKPYLNELDCVINWAKSEFPGRKIYLIGESWGGAIDLLYYKRFGNKIDGVFCWNMPTKIVNTQKNSFKEVWSVGWRELLCFLTNIEFKLPLNVNHREHLSRNQLLLRVLAMQENRSESSKSTICVWRCMRPSYKFMLKNCNNPKYNFLYIQSGQDALETKKHIKKIEAKADKDHYKRFKTGFHILCMEEKESIDLFKELVKFAQKK